MVKLLIQLAKTRELESGQEARKMIRKVNKNKDTALHEAVRWDSVHVVKEILGEEDLDYKYGVNDSGETPLYLAAHHRSILSLDVMLKAYKNKAVAYQGPNGKTVLHAAIVYCSEFHDMITSQITENMGSLVNEADANGWTPLHYAVCFTGSYVVSKVLEKDTRSAYMRDNDRQRTPLQLAACLGNLDSMRKIISMCSDCAEITDYRGWNVCHFAAISKSSRALQLILEDGSLAHLARCRDANGYSPIELYFFSTYNTSNYGWNLGMYSYMYDRLKVEPPDEILAKKVEIGLMTKELGNGPLGKIVAGTLAPDEKSPEEKRKEVEEKIIPELEKAKESHLVAAVLVATVTFAAAFTLPGGYVSDSDNSNNLNLGSPILSKNAAFKAFVITDGIAMVLSMSSVFIHFIMVMLGYKQKYYWLMRSAFWFIVIAMGAMVVAFVTGTYAVLATDSFRLALLTCLIGLTFFLFVFYTVVRLISYIACRRVIVINDIPYLGPRYLCCDCCKPLFYCCACCCSCICYPIFGLAYIVSLAWGWFQQLGQQHHPKLDRNQV